MRDAGRRKVSDSRSPDVGVTLRQAVDEFDLVRGVVGMLDRSVFFPQGPDGKICVAYEEGPDLPSRVGWVEPTAFPQLDDDRSLELAISYCSSKQGDASPLRVWIHGTEGGLRILYGVPKGDDHGGVVRDPTPVVQQGLQAAFPGLTFGRDSDPIGTVPPQLADSLRRRRALVSVVGIPSERDRTQVRTSLDDALLALSGRDFDVFVEARPVAAETLGDQRAFLERVVNDARDLGSTTERERVGEAVQQRVTEAVNRSLSELERREREVGGGQTTEGRDYSRKEDSSRTSSSSIAHDVVSLAATAAAAFVLVNTGNVTAARATRTAVNGLKRALGATIDENVVATGRERATSTEDWIRDSEVAAETTEKAVSSGSSTDLTSAVERMVEREAKRFFRQAKTIEDHANAQLERLDRCRGMGGWVVSVHVAANTEGDARFVANLLVGSLRGDASHLEPLRVVSYERDSTFGQSVPSPAQLVGEGRSVRRYFPVVTPMPGMADVTTLLASDELAYWIRPPNRALPGLQVRPVAKFSSPGRGALPSGSSHVELGCTVLDGRPFEGVPMVLTHEELCSHAFIAGTTGAGKTSTVRHILRSLQGLQPRSHHPRGVDGPIPDPFPSGSSTDVAVPIMVLEPAKREYRDLFDELVAADRNPIRLVLGEPRTAHERRLRFNPLAAPVGLPVGRHAEGIKVLLRSCFEMQESLPQILERLLFDAYERLGWKDLTKTVAAEDRRRMPTLASLLAEDAPPGGIGRGIRRVDRTLETLGYERRVRDTLAAAITVRLESFTRGLKRSVFGQDTMDFAELLSRPVFVELSDIGEPDIRRFLLGALMLRIYGEREAARVRALSAGVRPPSGLHHLLVLEEAHHFLRSSTGAGPSAELIRQSNQLMADAFAELRSMGQGILVADQAPADLDASVLRNTGTKLIHRLLHADDCKAVGAAMGLSDEQQAELRRLDPGQCVVMSPRLRQPVCCQVPATFG